MARQGILFRGKNPFARELLLHPLIVAAFD
jgi:hypothetical protein